MKRCFLLGVMLLLVGLHQAAAQISFAPAANYFVGHNCYPQSVTTADVNGDGKIDLISADDSYNPNGALTVLTNIGNGSFVIASIWTASQDYSAKSVVVADVNGDGWMDLISANFGYASPNGNTLSVLTNNGHGGFVLSSTPIVGTGPRSLVATDVNGDGRIEVHPRSSCLDLWGLRSLRTK